MPLASHSQSQSTRSAVQASATRVTSRNATAKGPALSGSSAFEHARASRKHSSSNNYSHTETIDEAYEDSGLPDESRLGRNRSNSHSHSNSHSNSSSFSRTDALLARTGQGRIQSAGINPAASAASVPDANFRTGIKMIQQAYEDKYQALEEEVNTWKWISEEQSTQMTAMAAELAKVEGEYAALRKEMAQLEMFRKAIVSMVDQHSGVSLAELEQSILGTIEADAENLEAGYDAAIDADTSSFMLDDDGMSSIAPLPAHGQHHREDYPTRERAAGMSVSAAVASSFKFSPQRLAPRPRASTETAVKRPRSTQQNMDVKNRSMVMRESLSPLAQHSAPNSRRRTEALSDSSSSGLKMLQKSGSTDSLRKRNTISAPSRPLYPAASHSIGNPSKRHSSISPLSPRMRGATSSSRAATGSNSFTSNSTPSTSPRQPLLNHAASTAAATISNSMAARTARQHQQQKEYSLGVRSSMSHLAGGSAVAPKSSNQNLRERRQPSSEESPGVQRNQSSQSNGAQSSQNRAHRSNSGAASVNALSPAAIELLREQELQQRHEEEQEEESGPHPRRTSNGHAGGRASHHYQPSEDEEQRRMVHHTRTRSGTNGSVRSHHQLQKTTELETDDVHGHLLRSGNESSSRIETTSPTRHRQSQLYGDQTASTSKSAGISKATESQQQQQRNGGVDASAFTMLYKEIRDSMDATSFGLFARVVTAFNEGEKTTEETLQEVGKIVKDQGLNQRFRDLIHQAIAEKESQLENDGGNETLEGDITLDMDQSLLVEQDDVESVNAAEVSMAQDVTGSGLTADTDDSSVSDDPDYGLAGAMGALELTSAEPHLIEEGGEEGHVEVLVYDDDGSGVGMGSSSESKRTSYLLHMRSV
ncbi:hypothetical protein BGZ75_004877 [Mortierella antarctica]|nr:hypothetical protein BGZ75_004877 [Mortierella antarctica]